MPIFEFYCNNCGYVFDRLVKDRDVEGEECEECGHIARKILSCPNFRVHGFNAENGYSSKGYAEEQVKKAKAHNKELKKYHPEKFAQ